MYTIKYYVGQRKNKIQAVCYNIEGTRGLHAEYNLKKRDSYRAISYMWHLKISSKVATKDQ